MSLLSRLAVQAARAYGVLSSRSTNVSADYLVVAGGGGGGGTTSEGAAGGGGGGFRTSAGTSGGGASAESAITLSTLTTYTITVGAGGNGGTTAPTIGSNGSNSSISGTGLTTITSTGGGGGAIGDIAPPSSNGASGGSGGGGGYFSSGGGTGGAGTANQGFAGGNGGSSNSTYRPGGGGGGAGAVGQAGQATKGGNGGAGVSSSISGSSVGYAGGGGGSSFIANTPGTATDGGASCPNTNSNGNNGTANTGGGGSAASRQSGGGSYTGGAGGSGVVIISYTSATPKFVGGTITTSGGKQIHTFTSSGTLSPITPITASYLVVAGGAGGGTNAGGGGGAGGLLTSSTTIYSGATYVVTVGGGGSTASNGSNSVLSGTGITTVTSTGGGAGGGFDVNGSNGGSGGGSGGGFTQKTGGTGTSGQGTNGGNGSVDAGGTSANLFGGGGGGATSAGGNATTTTRGASGSGTASSISGSSVTYAVGGQGGGGFGGTDTGVGVNGTSNLGNGGGGGGAGANGGAGGSGVVIISYAGSQAFNGGLVTSSGGNTIHTFTSTGALTPLTNNLNNSLRFRSSASAYLNRTPASAGSQTTWTWSAWVKRGSLGSLQKIFTAGSTGSLFSSFEFIAGDNFQFYAYNGATNAYLITTQVFRDPSAWYHITFVCDTTQATSSNRLKLYINGNQVTAFSTSTYPSQNFAFPINNNVIHNIGRDNINATYYFDGYLADVNFIDGQALEPYYFGNNDANGVWKPIQYKGTYGTNGFYLTFGNTTSTTTLGYDSSPNGNNWTCNNISLTAGTTYDAMTDVPTNTSATVANYAVMNPLQTSSLATVTDANLTVKGNSASNSGASVATMQVPTGLYYAEFTITGSNAEYPVIGVVNTDTLLSNSNLLLYGFPGYYSGVGYQADGQKRIGSLSAYGSTFTTGDVIGIAVDTTNGAVYFSKNNTWQNSGVPTSGASKTGAAYTYTAGSISLIMSVAPYNTSSGVNANFGQRPFTYTPPTGYVALNTYNLPTPTILQGNKYMDATLYTGNGVSQTVVNQGQFKSDLIWIKQRNGTEWNILADSIRGTNKQLFSNSTNAEQTNATFLTAFANNGFTVDTSTGTNGNGSTYVGWQWQAGQGSTSSNTSGSITSTVSVNTTAGFSVVTYTSQASSTGTVGHGLGVAPKLIIIKLRGIANNWTVYHASTGATGYLNLNTTGAFATSSGTFANTAPTSSVFTLGTDWAGSYTSVAYCWAEIAGFSRFGSYTGNGSADGPMVYCNFLPKFIIIKQSSAAGENWFLYDTARNTYNVMDLGLFPNTSGAEASISNTIDVLSNGFKLRGSFNGTNQNGATYIFMAFASNPFKNSLAR